MRCSIRTRLTLWYSALMAVALTVFSVGVSVIQTAAEVTLERQTREDWEYREALTIVNEQSTRLSRMVEDMLVLARADAGGYRLTRRPLYVDEIVAECVRAVSVVASTRDIQFVTALQPRCPSTRMMVVGTTRRDCEWRT